MRKFPVLFVICHLSFVIFLAGCGDLDQTVSSVTVSPASTTVGINQSKLFSAYAYNSEGQLLSNISFTWSVSGAGTISSSGYFTAGSSTGEGTVTAAYQSLSNHADVSVTDKGWIAGKVYNSKGTLTGGLKVYLKNTSLFDYSDSTGKYTISNIPAGTYEAWTLETSVYRAASREVTVASGETKSIDFTVLFFTDPPDLTPPTYEY